MKRMIYTFFFLHLYFISSFSQTNLFIDTSYTVEQMVTDFFGTSCAQPYNITANGTKVMFAYFEGANSNLGINAGIVISSGETIDIDNPSDFFANTAMGSGGDGDLTDLSGTAASHDAAVLEFDLDVSEDGALDFNYVFGSEEYPEYVGSSFNDVFGFLITPENSSQHSNIAMIPGADIPVTINNVNDAMNAQFYVDNTTNINPDIVYDGMTVPLMATFTAMGNTTYHVKIGVSDIGDQIFDSGVFIGIESLCGDSLLVPPADALAAVNGNTVSFTNLSRYATSWHWDFGDNSTSDERYPASHTYAQDGFYTVTLTTKNWCCEDTYSFTVQIGDVNSTLESVEKPFTISPNPATDWVNIDLSNNEVLDYQLTDLMGRIVQKGVWSENTRMDLSQVAPGTYFFLIQSENESFIERLIIE